jgi:8-oxo-dGTP pyrophosphatase MutT (NUDIX family)
MTSFYQTKSNYICSNCGESGHTFRLCSEPVSSYGVLIIRWISPSDTWPLINEFCKDQTTSTGTNMLIPQILMIQRKDSLGFMDIMRGKYKVNEPDYIKKQLRGMTSIERNKLETMEFEDIWHELWGSDTESSQRYAHDRIVSRQKLAELRHGIELPTGEKYTLYDLLRQEPTIYKTPEWGFPKGRRDPYESDIQCAFRELTEETSIKEDELLKMLNVAPLVEQFYGSNDVHYRHTYYIAQYIGERNISFDALNSEMAREIGNLSWVTLDQANLILRPENLEKHEIILQLRQLLENYIPVIRNELTTIPLASFIKDSLRSTNENTNQEQQRQYVFINRYRPSESVSGRMEKPRRFFGTRQVISRVSELHSTNQNSSYERNGSRFS